MTGRLRFVVAGLSLTCWAGRASEALASPLPPNITVDRMVGKIAGWSIGYSDSLGGCLAAATYADGTTIWFGLRGAANTSYIAFTNPKWRSIEVGGQYDLRLLAAGQGRWHGTFTGFERGDALGLFQSGLRDGFVKDMSNAGSIGVVFKGRQIATLSLVGSTEALDAVVACHREASIAKARAGVPGSSPPHTIPPGMVSTGTGFFVSERGHVLTNHHVVDGCSSYSVKQPGAPLMNARFVASDATNDLAVLSTDYPQKVVPPLSVRARIGESVFVYGFPQSDTLASTGNFTIGNVTATAGMHDDTRDIQISAPIHKGNSGGPVLDQYGNVVGIVQSKASDTAFAESRDVPQNVNFAIKTTIALNFLDANRIEAPINVRTSNPMDGATIAELAKEFTVQVICR